MGDEKALKAEEAYGVDKAAVEGKQCRDDEGAARLGRGQELVGFCQIEYCCDAALFPKLVRASDLVIIRSRHHIYIVAGAHDLMRGRETKGEAHGNVTEHLASDPLSHG